MRRYLTPILGLLALIGVSAAIVPAFATDSSPAATNDRQCLQTKVNVSDGYPPAFAGGRFRFAFHATDGLPKNCRIQVSWVERYEGSAHYRSVVPNASIVAVGNLEIARNNTKAEGIVHVEAVAVPYFRPADWVSSPDPCYRHATDCPTILRDQTLPVA